jgi:class 3 adenylate cyclase
VEVARAIAEQVATLTRPHTVAISAATARLVEGYFECKPLGRYRLAGDQEATMVYEAPRDGIAHAP